MLFLYLVEKVNNVEKNAKETHAEAICIEVENDCVLQVSHLFKIYLFTLCCIVWQ